MRDKSHEKINKYCCLVNRTYFGNSTVFYWKKSQSKDNAITGSDLALFVELRIHYLYLFYWWSIICFGFVADF